MSRRLDSVILFCSELAARCARWFAISRKSCHRSIGNVSRTIDIFCSKCFGGFESEYWLVRSGAGECVELFRAVAGAPSDEYMS